MTDTEEICILETEFNEVPTVEVGGICVRNNTQFDGYTSRSIKDFHAGFMSSGEDEHLDDELTSGNTGKILRAELQSRVNG